MKSKYRTIKPTMILVTKASRSTYWYANKLPMTATVNREDKTHYVVESVYFGMEKLILKKDCK